MPVGLWLHSMRAAHLSDLHFGSHVSPEKLDSLRSDLVSHALELLVITGDVTDRGRLSQFRWARDFLRSLEIPYIMVPGNREVGFSAVWEWMLPSFAMRRYRHFFGASDQVVYHSESSKVVFMGLNSVHSFPSWPGTVSRETRHWLKEQASRFEDYLKVLFLHHPVLPVIRSSSFWAHSLSDAGEILNICTQNGIKLILQGHKHRSAVMEVNFPQREARVVVSSCGAPLMSRWDSVYHLMDLSPATILIHPREFFEGEFVGKGSYEFFPDGNRAADRAGTCQSVTSEGLRPIASRKPPRILH
jgi:3',5'-cyclic AMP phosphodiesterase CpdA